jgi:Transposase DDE domain
MKLQRRVKTVQQFIRQRRGALQFDGVRDPRKRRGRRWLSQTLLETAVTSLMMQARSLRAAERMSSDLADCGRLRGLKRRVPDSTLGDFMARVSPTSLRQHLREQILVEHRRRALEPTVLPIRAIAVDGKNVATLDHAAHKDCQKQSGRDGAPPHWLYRVVNATLISSAAAVCIDQEPIPAKTNDMGVFAHFFAGLLRTYGRANLFEVVTCDAGFCSEQNARLVDEAGVGYWFSLKDNQPELRQEAERVLLAAADASAPEAQTDWECDSSRGWIRRQLWRTNEMAGWGKWTHLRQVVLVRVLVRDERDGAERVLENRYYVTNLVHGRLDGHVMLRLVRAHWRIENDLHGALDIQWQEDHGRWVQRGNGLPVTTLLRALAYNLLSLMRDVHLRSCEARAATWDQLRNWVRDALVWPELIDSDIEVLVTP